MAVRPRRFVRRAPSKTDKSRWVDVRVTDMNAADAAWWDARLGGKHVRLPRADRYWVWSVLLPMCHVVQLAKHRHCRALVIWARDDQGRFLRVGMSILIEAIRTWMPRGAGNRILCGLSAPRTRVLKADFG